MAGNDPETESRLREAGAGDAAALRWLLDRHRDRLRRMIALRLDERLSPRLDASDLVQETLMDASRKLDTYLRDRPLPFYPWLHRLAIERLAQTHRHHLRALRREAGRERGAPWPESSVLRLVDALAVSGPGPSEQLIRQEECLRIRRALEELSEQDREILVMRYLEHLDFGEIAAIQGITEGAARVRHFRALQRLAPMLGEPGEGAGA